MNRFDVPVLLRAASFQAASFQAAICVAAGFAIAVSAVSAAEAASVSLAASAAGTPESVARQTLLDALAPALAARGATAVVTVSAADPRRAAAPCEQLAGFMPPGARLTGRTLVGLRCADGSPWQTFVSADVRVEASTWQTTRALRAGEPIGASDVTALSAALTAADLDSAAAGATMAGGPVRGASTFRSLASLDGRLPAPIGRIAQRPVAMGRPLTAGDVRDEGRINAGDPVRVVYQGDGFAVSSDGHAVGAADPGGSVSIRLASGALVNGTLRADHLVELPH